MRYFYFFAITLLFGCSDFLETDVSDDTVFLLSPPNNYATPLQTQQFWWEKVNGADFYNLQIVSPSFDFIVDLVLDTVISTNTFDITLPSGDYQWSVWGFNSAYTSQSEIFDLTITEDSTLTGQNMLAVSPANNTITNNSSITFLWQELALADWYRLEVATPDFTNSTFIVLNDTTSNDFYTTQNLADGQYVWRVRGENEESQSFYTDTRTLIVDQTPPTTPSLTNPTDGSAYTLHQIVPLQWSSDPTAAMDSLYLYDDNGWLQTLPITTQQYDFVDSTATGTINYQWQVRSVDAAGNVSGFSGLHGFSVN